jgi:hypothetical protein
MSVILSKIKNQTGEDICPAMQRTTLCVLCVNFLFLFRDLAIFDKIREVRAASFGCRINQICFGLWLSLVERLVRDQEAVGSNPTSPIELPPVKQGELQ